MLVAVLATSTLTNEKDFGDFLANTNIITFTVFLLDAQFDFGLDINFGAALFLALEGQG